MKNRVTGNISGDTISVFINGEHFQFRCESEDIAKEQFQEIVKTKADPTDANVEALLNFVSPDHKVLVQGDISQDRLGNYYLGGINIPMPTGLMRRMREQLDAGLPVDNLVNFWKLLILNPDTHIRTSLFRFMDQFNMPITDQGYFIGYKSVAFAGVKEMDYANLITGWFVYERANGNNPDELEVFQGVDAEGIPNKRYDLINHKTFEKRNKSTWEDYCEERYTGVNIEYLTLLEYTALSASEQAAWTIDTEADTISKETPWHRIPQLMGTLTELFNGVNEVLEVEGSEFTDWHTKKSTIKLGVASTMKRDDCDNNEQVACSSGLHVGAPGYVASFGGGDENYILACLVNPMNVVAIPDDYSFQKLRCCEYLPYAICEMTGGKIKEIDTQYFEEDYTSHEAEVLAEELKKYQVIIDEGDEVSPEIIANIESRLVYLNNQ